MNNRTAQLRQQSLDTPPRISAERAVLLTEFYQANDGLFFCICAGTRRFISVRAN
jgi:hypothetical protein